MGLRLERMTTATAATLLSGQCPSDIEVAADYPTEFSKGVASQVATGSELGPYVIYSPTESIVVGEIGGAFTGEGTVEIGYAIVKSHWGRGIATEAVRELVRRIALRTDVQRVVAHTPFDRPESARVVEKAGFTFVREVEDIHESGTVRVKEWELLTSGPDLPRPVRSLPPRGR
jgi:RimJ/RimL family protein N-acetyltransferase